jgi:putative transposase
LLRRLTVREGKDEVFRFWLPGGGFDENIWNEQPSPEILDYIHMNPVRRELVEHPTDWVWSSARFWSGDRDVPLLMDPIDV